MLFIAAALVGIVMAGKELAGTGDQLLLIAVVPMSLVCGGVFALIVGIFIPTKWVKVRTIALVNAHTVGAANGGFFLGTGSLEGGEAYIYYYHGDDGSIRQGHLSANSDVGIFENREHKEGRLEVYETAPRSLFWHLIGFHPPRDSYKFRIPEGSFVRGYRLG